MESAQVARAVQGTSVSFIYNNRKKKRRKNARTFIGVLVVEKEIYLEQMHEEQGKEQPGMMDPRRIYEPLFHPQI